MTFFPTLIGVGGPATGALRVTTADVSRVSSGTPWAARGARPGVGASPTQFHRPAEPLTVDTFRLMQPYVTWRHRAKARFILTT